MMRSNSTGTDFQAVCLCGGYGFPISASAARIIMVGKALQQTGIQFRVLHCGPSPVEINRRNSGTYEGIPFQYTTSVRRPKNTPLRLLTYGWGLLDVTVRLIRFYLTRRPTVVYLYLMDGPMNVYLGALCQVLQFPVIQEVCEWVPDQPTTSAFNQWLYKRRIFECATGALVISKAIETRVKERSKAAEVDILIHRVPVLVDAQRFANASPPVGNDAGQQPTFVYCGTWLRDVFFIIRAFARVKHAGHQCTLTIIGECGEKKGEELLGFAKEQGLAGGDVILTGCVDDRTLESLYKSATALLMPLWNDDKSITRLPNKMGEYLASSRPVITSQAGDLREFLFDGVNAYVANPGDEDDFARRMIAVLQDPARATEIGVAGQQTCFERMDYRSHASGLAAFFTRCAEYHSKRKGELIEDYNAHLGSN